jgi:hypothetical protein
MLRLALAPATLLFLALPATALADDDDDPPRPTAAPGTAIVQPAQTQTDPKTGAQVVVVPPGCSSVVQPSGQVVVFCPTAAPGHPPPPAYEARPRTETKWYGWQTLLVDGAALTTSMLLLSVNNDDAHAASAVVGLGGYALGGPIVHWSNGQVGKGFASLGLRVGAPVLGALTGAIVLLPVSDSDNLASAVGAIFGTIAGTAAAVAIDSAALARKRVTVTHDEAKRPTVQWTPTAGYDKKREAFSVGVGGTF